MAAICDETAFCWDAADTLSFFFFHAPPPTDIYTLSLHDALPIFPRRRRSSRRHAVRLHTAPRGPGPAVLRRLPDRKSTRLNSSHGYISYAVFCLKKKNYC